MPCYKILKRQVRDVTHDLLKAKYYVEECDYTCAIIKGQDIFTSTDRGVLPLLKLVDAGKSASGFSAADRVLGRGSAFLYIILGVTEIYAKVISLGAIELLKKNGITIYFKRSVRTVMNRSADGPCPIESALEGVEDPKIAVEVIKNTLQKLKGEENENS